MPDLARNLDGAPVLFDDRPDRRQSEPGTEAPGAEERVEDFGKHIASNPGPGIVKAEQHRAARFARAHRQDPLQAARGNLNLR